MFTHKLTFLVTEGSKKNLMRVWEKAWKKSCKIRANIKEIIDFFAVVVSKERKKGRKESFTFLCWKMRKLKW